MDKEIEDFLSDYVTSSDKTITQMSLARKSLELLISRAERKGMERLASSLNL